MKKIKVYEVINAYLNDIEVLKEDKTNTNRTKLIQRDMFMLQFLRTLPSDLVLNCEGTPIDPYKLNAGGITEMILKYHMNAHKDEIHELEKSGGLYDAKRGCINVEIKLSLNGSCYNTRIREPMLVYLVNRDGVFMIRKNDLDYVTNARGILPHKDDHHYLTRIDWLSKALGYEI